MAIYSLSDCVPHIPQSAYIAPEAIVIGKVTLGERTSVWPSAVIRGDDDTIAISDNSNVQDGAVLHVDRVTRWRLEPMSYPRAWPLGCTGRWRRCCFPCCGDWS